MVAVISPGRSLRATLNYNENKIQEKNAILIHAANYGKDTILLTFNDKLKRLTHLASLNNRVEVNSIHISLNFDPSEKDIPHATLSAIADKYMQGIGYGKQPYLVYEHKDSGHPHIHIVTTNVQANGIRIKSNNIGKNQSEKIRKALEIQYGLVKAERQRELQEQHIRAVSAQKVNYGKTETKRAIANVLKYVLSEYKYSSLPELNAILRQYNVVADRGSKDSRIYKNNGLVYRVLDERGEQVGVPVKASAIYFKPTLSKLEKNFAANQSIKEPYKQRIKNTIDLMFTTQKNLTIPELIHRLSKEQINVVPRQNDKGLIYGLTYIDHQKKVVWNGSDLGKAYSAAGILNRIQKSSDTILIQPIHRTKVLDSIILSKSPVDKNEIYPPAPLTFPGKNALIASLQTLLETEYAGTLNPELRDERKKKHRKKIHHNI